MDVQEVRSQFLFKALHVKYRTSGPGKSPIGELSIYENRVEWTTPNYAEKLVVPFSKIKNQRISPPNKPRVQLQLCMENEDQATFVFMNPDATPEKLQDERNTVREILQNALIAHRKMTNQMNARAEKSGNKELVIKQKILEENSHLQSLYLHLVKEKLISPQDFWAFHYKPTDNNKIDKIGISGGFLSCIEQRQESDGIKLNITMDVINAIFRTYPAVEQKHLELVPHEMTDQEFWAKFFQSHYFHRERNSVESSTTDPFADCAKSDEKDMREIVDQGANSLKRQRNLSYLEEDFGVLSDMRDSHMSLKSSMAKAMLVRRCNYHSERVLSTIHDTLNNLDSGSVEQSSTSAKNNVATDSGVFDMELDSQDLDDLQRETTEQSPLLNMASTANTHSQNQYSSADAEKYKGLVRICVDQTIMDENLKVSFFDIITTEELDEGKSSKSGAGNLFSNLSGKAVAEIRIVHACLAELLRHFWTCFPPITPELEEKMTRMLETLLAFEKKQLKACEMQYGTIYVEHCLEMLKKAKERFNSFLMVKKQRRK